MLQSATPTHHHLFCQREFYAAEASKICTHAYYLHANFCLSEGCIIFMQGKEEKIHIFTLLLLADPCVSPAQVDIFNYLGYSLVCRLLLYFSVAIVFVRGYGHCSHAFVITL